MPYNDYIDALDIALENYEIEMQVWDRVYTETSFNTQQDLRSSEYYDAEAASRGEFQGDLWDGDFGELANPEE